MNERPAYDDWHRQFLAEDDSQSVWHLFVKDNFSPAEAKDKTILEIGCGRGGLSDYLASRMPSFKKLYACDFSEGAIKIAKVRFSNHKDLINWQTEDIQALSFSDSFFDIVISCETIEHVPQPQMAIQELFRVLKPGGKLILTCPNYFNLFGLWCFYRYLIGKPYTEGQPYVNYLILPKLLLWIRRTGLKKCYFETSNLVIPLRRHYHFFEKKAPYYLKWFGFRCFFILKKLPGARS